MTHSVAMRLDANHQVGMGHLFRMLTLASFFEENGAPCIFLLRQDACTERLLQERNIPFRSYPVELSEEFIFRSFLARNSLPSLWIFDILNSTTEMVSRVQKEGMKVVTFDDLGQGASQADLVINAIAGCWGQAPSNPNTLCGPRFAILPPQLTRLARSSLNQPQNSLTKVGVSLGGSDTYGITPKIAELLASEENLEVHLFLGPHFSHFEALQSAIGFSQIFSTHHAVPDLHGQLATMDAVICGGGQTLFEVSSMGLPALAIPNESHEAETIGFFERNGACISAGKAPGEIDTSRFTAFLHALRNAPDVLANLSFQAQRLVDGKGAQRCYRACQRIRRETVHLKKEGSIVETS